MKSEQLLELAAKAAGWWQDNSQNLNGWQCNYPIGWNPLENDDDAFNLVIKLGIKVTPPKHVGDGVVANDCTAFDDDRSAAYRKAIVMAAARIGEKMEAE